MALLARGFSQLRTSLLQVVRFNVDTMAASSTGTWRGLQARGFASSTYLDKDDVTARIINIVKNFDNVDQTKVTPTSDFQKDLGLDSLDAVELVMAMEEEFAIEIPDSEADKIQTCSDAIQYISSHPMAK